MSEFTSTPNGLVSLRRLPTELHDHIDDAFFVTKLVFQALLRNLPDTCAYTFVFRIC